jgi:hypothetical protein
MADKLVRVLNGLGYQAVFLPKSGVSPPELWSFRRGNDEAGARLVRLGRLAAVLPAAAALQPTEGDLGDINAQYGTQKKFGAAVGFLNEALACIGVTAVPKIDLGFTGATEFAFAFTGVRYQAIDPLELMPLFGQLQTENLPKAYVDEGLLHVVYEYAYADELLLARGDRREFDLDISGKVGEFIDLGGKGSVSVTSKSAISFKGQPGARAAFAYKAGRLVRERGRWTFLPEEVLTRGLVEERRPFVPQPAVALHAVDETT